MIDGVCCQYCEHFESRDCPVGAASPWSRWRDFCGKYEPNKKEEDAVTIKQAF